MPGKKRHRSGKGRAREALQPRVWGGESAYRARCQRAGSGGDPGETDLTRQFLKRSQNSEFVFLISRILDVGSS